MVDYLLYVCCPLQILFAIVVVNVDEIYSMGGPNVVFP